MTQAVNRCTRSEAITDGIRVRAEPSYLGSHSDPERGRYIFAYRIQLTNEGEHAARLLTRFWRIVDADGQEHVVDGPGVTGKNPLLEPGGSFEYSSFCPLGTSWGTMEGHFTFERTGGETFRAEVARFYLTPGGQ